MTAKVFEHPFDLSMCNYPSLHLQLDGSEAGRYRGYVVETKETTD